MTNELSEAIQDAIGRARAVVRVGYPWWMRPFVWRGVAAITIGRRVYVSREMTARGFEQLEKLLRHELTHVRQAGELGLLRFFYRYLSEYVRLRRAGYRSHEAYRRISFEVEAFDAEEVV